MLWVFLIALGVLTVVGVDYRDDPFFRTPVSDAASYDTWARRLAATGYSDEPGFHQSPLFPVMLAAAYRAAPQASMESAALVLQSVLLAAAIALLVPLGRALFDRRAAGLAAAGVALLYAPLVFYSLKRLPVALAVATQALALVLVLRLRDLPGARHGALAGVGVGLACLARAEFLLFVPVALILLHGLRERRATFAGFVAGVVLTIAPVTVHNFRHGDTTLIASAAGENLFIGNQPGGDGGHQPLDPKAGDLRSQRVLARRIAEQARGEPLSGSAVSAYWIGRAWSEIASAPGEWLRLEGRKFKRWLSPGDPTDLYSMALERGAYVPSLYAFALPTLGLWLLAGAGVVVVRSRRERRAWPLFAILLLHLLVLMVFFVSTRLRLPFLFWLCPLAGLGAASAIERWRSGSKTTAAILLTLVVAIAATDLVRQRPPDREVLRLAAVLSSQDRLEESLDVMEPFLRRTEPDPALLDQAGWVHSKRGELDEALSFYERALGAGLNPRQEQQTLSRMAGGLERLHRLQEAAAAHDRSIAMNPAEAGAWFERAMFRLRRGDRPGAIVDLQEANRLLPEWDPPKEALRSLAAGDR